MSEQDTREKLEADVRDKWLDGFSRDAVIALLDRQAAITERTHAVDNLVIEELRKQLDELTAERDKLLDERGCMAGSVFVLTAECDQLSRDLTAEHALVAQFEYDNERLREAIDAMENGQFYAMYRQACEERDALKYDREKVWCDCDCCGWQAEREQMQRVIDTQRESFRKMEFDLAQAKGNRVGG